MKTNRTLKLITLTAAIFGFAATSFGQLNPNVNATANATAKIIIPISIVNTDAQPLAFGNIIANSVGGTVSIAASDAAQSTSSTMSFPTNKGTMSAAKFTVTGFDNSAYTISLPADNAVSLSGPTGSTAMKITDFVHDAGQSPVLNSGSGEFYVGGTLNVNASQAAGDYLGEFQVTVHYN